MDESSSNNKRDLEKWDCSNHMSIMIMKCAIPKTFRGYKSYDLTLKTNFKMRIAWFFEDVEFWGRNKVKDVTFEEESILVSKLIPTVAFNNIQVSIPIVIQKENPKPLKDDVDQTPTQFKAIILEEQA